MQFDNAARYAGDGFATFQIVLQRDGTILLYYKELTGNITSATVGIQDGTKTHGITVVSNQPYLKNNLAVRILDSAAWLAASPQTFTLEAGASTTVNALIDAAYLNPASYSATVHLATTSAPPLTADVPVTLRVNSAPDVVITSPVQGIGHLGGDEITFAATANDPDGVAKVEFYDGTSKIGEATGAPFAIAPVALVVGSHSITARATDSLGAVQTSAPVVVNVQVDSDHDGLGDDWEMQYFGNLDQGAGDDADHDGLTNIQEFRAGTNPLSFDDTDGDGLSDGDEINVYHTNPRVADTDGDGMPDGYEVLHGLDPLHNDASGDLDGDGLTNVQEYYLGTNPSKFSTVDDGISDGWKVRYGLSPFDSLSRARS